MKIDVNTTYGHHSVDVEENSLCQVEKQSRMIQAKDQMVSLLVNCRQGERLIITLEPLSESDDVCVSCSMVVKDGPGKQVFTDHPFKIVAVAVHDATKVES
ncbi:hypothetical protein [Dyadobacter sp. Leaf189]|uniref:hypothetical protein n=1 Tax=Dyadobacter sp. Leaf189 TaxID=1736295 RepID=UPI0006FDD5D2|nr:hypothetical protein [Dyadobacter sp. Leaf189]KQS33956.1 hypothetical protein ASG33_07965 [Dyadobacter sp. Leaf189]